MDTIPFCVNELGYNEIMPAESGVNFVVRGWLFNSNPNEVFSLHAGPSTQIGAQIESSGFEQRLVGNANLECGGNAPIGIKIEADTGVVVGVQGYVVIERTEP